MEENIMEKIVQYNSSYKVTDEVYDNLHGCCKYRDNPE